MCGQITIEDKSGNQNRCTRPKAKVNHFCGSKIVVNKFKILDTFMRKEVDLNMKSISSLPINVNVS